MKNVISLKKGKLPLLDIDQSLEKLRGRNLFPEKLANANKTISKVGLPKN